MKEEDLREGIWYKVSGFGYGPYDFIRIYHIDLKIFYDEAVSGGIYVQRDPICTFLQSPYKLTLMTQVQKEEFLPEYKPRQ